MKSTISTREHWIPLEVLYVIGIIAISFSSIFIRWSDANVSVIAMYRLYFTDLLLLPLALRHYRALLHIPPRVWLMLALSGLMLALHFLFWMGSLRLTTVASSTVILTLEPIMVVIGSYFLFKTRTNRYMIIGMALAVIGSVAIGWGDFSVSGTAFQGDMLSFFGTIAVAVHMLISKQVRSHMDALVYNFWVFFMAATVLAFYNIAQGIPFTGYEARDWGVFWLLALVPTLFGHYLFNWLLKYMNAGAVSMAVLGEPVFSSLLAFWLLGEALTGIQLGAGTLILIGVWVFIRFGNEKEKTLVPPDIMAPEHEAGDDSSSSTSTSTARLHTQADKK
ncbi:DMT family transporter [Paenibacillus hunanensis]|uniref:Drug/metabolite transporter (DMT)-like permease n=1 Tax=Paenibacillus hunanensis TaxID=539262 RepID=A0ABU1IY48_9BACL|nr:DMT family transporter [Paenibacillus hunanensis]MDR6244187.1 drug/metabolite transporter (DMT)-like permease [Paenibacillus hunanensis]GGJ18787.1 multidrug transporter [Paenibacillus hunanensis]